MSGTDDASPVIGMGVNFSRVNTISIADAVVSGEKKAMYERAIADYT
jgi:hypothetical protein